MQEILNLQKQQEKAQEKPQDETLLQGQNLNQSEEWKREEHHLQNCVQIIQHNIDDYFKKYSEISAETKELYDNYRSNNPELHNELVTGLDMRSMMKRLLNKNLLAIKKPYFGRIDYKEIKENETFSLYLGKNGIRKNIAENLIVDWRAPVSTIYYDSDIGESSYQTPSGETIDILLNLKRTFEISDSKLIDFYDSNVIANDEFLTKYLSKNKEVVLGEIIATIQKEQNMIIRDSPWHSVIVQGVAGSGKTTVAMHRISYILYNYKDKFRPDEFYIIGSNKMLLNYITGVLPNLDVYNVNQMTMEEFLLTLLDKDFDYKKNKYSFANNFTKLQTIKSTKNTSEQVSFKGSTLFIKALEEYMKQFELAAVNKEAVRYHNSILMSKEDILYFLSFFEELPLQEKITMLNKRLTEKIAYINEENRKSKEETKAEVNKYKEYFGSRNKKYNITEVYKEFLIDLSKKRSDYRDKKLFLPEQKDLELILSDFLNKKLDIYDLGMLNYIKKRLKKTKDYEYVSHIIIDEAQDFGVLLFYLFKKLFKNCTYTIMGDVSQNIYYNTGMNDWETLKQEVFLPNKDRFYCLAKSYRNTVEISNYASKVLKKCSFKTYDIEPIIRHGKEVSLLNAMNEQQRIADTVDIILNARRAGYDTIAVICRTIEETLKVKEQLKDKVPIEQPDTDIEKTTFQNGIMVLPIHMTKGLEFDVVIIWNPDEKSYRLSDGDAKLLYVAITRALHELDIVYEGKLSDLLL